MTSIHLFEVGSGEIATLNSQVTEHPLLVSFLKDVLFYGLFRDESIDVHVSRLSDAVATILSLQ